jgi:rsbT antagonist protein RsbS
MMNVAGGCLIAPFKEQRGDQATLEFQREVFEQSIRRRTRGIILDVSSVSLMDSFMGNSLVGTCLAGRILGQRIIVVGLRPAVVAALVDLDIDMSCVVNAVNVEAAIAILNPAQADEDPLETKDAPTDEDEDGEIEEKEDDEETCEEGLSE